MHFCVFKQSGENVEKYMKRLDKYLGVKYSKTDQMIYEKLKNKTKEAIKNAKTVEEEIKTMDPGINFNYDYDPYTSVYKLVEELIDI